MTNADPVRFLHIFVGALEIIGAMGIVSSGWADLAVSRPDSSMMAFVDYIPYDWLFQRVAAAPLLTPSRAELFVSA